MTSMILRRTLLGFLAAVSLLAETPAKATSQTNQAFEPLIGQKYSELFAMFKGQMQAALPVDKLHDQVVVIPVLKAPIQRKLSRELPLRKDWLIDNLC